MASAKGKKKSAKDLPQLEIPQEIADKIKSGSVKVDALEEEAKATASLMLTAQMVAILGDTGNNIDHLVECLTRAIEETADIMTLEISAEHGQMFLGYAAKGVAEARDAKG